MSNAVMVLENGFEEIEAIIPADILRRIGVEVYLASSSNPVQIGRASCRERV